uniref:Uncharacterized protein n=1 Tax=viral metagenome TaxID=1070528 RepID=A0A6M3LPK6_9ZZZZ
MKILVAREFDTNRFEKVGVFSVRMDGTMSLPMRYNGTMEAHFIRAGARHLLDESAAQSVDLRFGSSPTWRIHRI